MPIEVGKSLGREGDILELDEAHGPVCFGTEAKPLIAPLLREGGLELLLGSVQWKIAHIQRVARWVLVCRVDCWQRPAKLLVVA